MPKKTAWKKFWNQRWWLRSGCDGRIMAKFLITIQVNLVPIPSKAWRSEHKFAWIVVIKNFAIILPSQPLLGHHLWFHNFFYDVFFGMGHIFFTVWLCRFHLFLQFNLIIWMCFVAGGNEECINRSSETAVEPQSSVPLYFVFFMFTNIAKLFSYT